MVEPTEAEIEAAIARGKGRMRGPRAQSARYDAGRNRIIVRLTTGVEIGFAPHDAEGLQHASVEDLKAIELQEFGLGIHFPRLDADIYVPALLRGVLGSKSWMTERRAAAAGPMRNTAGLGRPRQAGTRGRGRPRSAGHSG